MVFISFNIIANGSTIVKVIFYFFTTFFDRLFLVFLNHCSHNITGSDFPLFMPYCAIRTKVRAQCLLLLFLIFRAYSLAALLIGCKPFSQYPRLKRNNIRNTEAL